MLQIVRLNKKSPIGIHSLCFPNTFIGRTRLESLYFESLMIDTG